MTNNCRLPNVPLAAVFQYLEEESLRGNPEPVIGFLETATVVSAILLEDAQSVSEASAAIFKFLDHHSDETSVSERSAAVFSLLDENNAARSSRSQGQAAYNPNNINDNQSVISETSAAVFRLLEDA